MPFDFDVIIAGGGIIGASIAWRLARNHRRVLLLDAAKIGAQASSAAAGMLAPGGEFDQPSPLLDVALRSLANYDAYVEALQADSGLPIEFRHATALQIARTSAELQALTQRAAVQRSAGIPSAVVSREEIRALVPLAGADAIGGIHYLQEAIVDPVGLIAALRAACLARGVSIREESPAASISANAIDTRVTLARPSGAGEMIQASFAVIAAGAWSTNIAVTIDAQRHAIPPSFPIKGHLLGYRLPPGSLAAVVRHRHTYVFQRANGLTIAGSSNEDAGFDRSIDPKIVSDLAARAGALVPVLASLQPESVWTGLRPYVDGSSPNHGPLIGRVRSSRLWLAYGHYRNGILLAPATCDQVCQEMAAEPCV